MLAFISMSGGQILLIMALFLIFFGAKKIPDLAKGLGQGIKEFKKATREVTDELNNSANYTPPPPPPAPPAPAAPTEPRQAAQAAPAEQAAAIAQSTGPKA